MTQSKTGFKVEEPGFYWRADGTWVFVELQLSSNTNHYWLVYYGHYSYTVDIFGNNKDPNKCLVEYIGKTMPDTETRSNTENNFRPWTVEEVPVGAVVRGGSSLSPRLIVEINSFNRVSVGNSLIKLQALKDFEWKWPNESDSAWRRCGVPVS